MLQESQKMNSHSIENQICQMAQPIAEELMRETRRRELLAHLLGEQQEKSDHLLAIHTRMGGMSSYITSVSLSWVYEKVRLANDLPLFRCQSVDWSKQSQADQCVIESVKNLCPNWENQLPMTLYLAAQKNHKFPPMVVVAYQSWLHDESNANWDDDKRALRHSISVRPLDPSGLYCDLNLKNTDFFVFDGQHRLLAIRGLKEFLDTGRLYAKNIDGVPDTRKEFTREMIARLIQDKTGEKDSVRIDYAVSRLMDERIGLEIVPAVLFEETIQESVLRLSRLFVDFNEKSR